MAMFVVKSFQIQINGQVYGSHVTLTVQVCDTHATSRVSGCVYRTSPLTITTYITYVTRTRSTLDVACVPRTYTVNVTCVLSAHATSYPRVKKKKHIQKHIRTKKDVRRVVTVA